MLTPEQTYQALIYGNLIGWGLLIFSYITAGPWIKAYTLAKLQNKKVAIEYDKTKEYRPFAADIPKDLRNFIKLSGNRGIVGIRRESIGHSNKTQTMLFSSEFEYTISPTEIKGKRYVQVEPQNTIEGFLDEGNFIEISNHPKTKKWVEVPEMETVSPEQFVRYQQINADPLITEHYAQHKEQALRDSVNNPAAMFISQYGWFIITLIVAGGLVYMWMGQNNQAANCMGDLQQCKDGVIELFNKGVCQSRPGIDYDITQFKGGGAVI
jgi:hypothetical protein